MISKQMLDWGANGNSIREIAAYGERRAAEIGAENVYNFSIGSPSIDPPDCVHAAVEHLLHTVPPPPPRCSHTARCPKPALLPCARGRNPRPPAPRR